MIPTECLWVGIPIVILIIVLFITRDSKRK